jgi:hypothetical protein
MSSFSPRCRLGSLLLRRRRSRVVISDAAAGTAIRRAAFAAAVETLEKRQLMSVTAVDAAAVANGTPYSLHLHRTAGESGATIDWGDGSTPLGSVSFTSGDDASTTHTYASTGTVSITITPVGGGTHNAASDGTFDNSFDQDGKKVTSVDPNAAFDAVASQGVIDGQERYLAAGTFNGEFAVARFFASDGTLDTDFGDAGYAKVPAPNGGVSANLASLAVAADQSILAVGSSSQGLVVLRLDKTGQLAPETFTAADAGGRLSSESLANDVALDGSGGFYVAGATGGDSLLLHFNAGSLSTSLDISFNSNNGAVITDVAGTGDDDAASCVAVGPGGRVAIGALSGGVDAYVESYDANGGNARGTQVFAMNGVKDVTFDAAGGILAAGFAQRFGGQRDAEITRLVNSTTSSTALDLDGTFGSGGVAVVSGGGTDAFFLNVQLAQDGKLLATGTLFNTDGVPTTLVARFTAGGLLDTLFAGSGYKACIFYTSPTPPHKRQ